MPELPRYSQKSTLPDSRSTGAQVDVNQTTRVTRAAGDAVQKIGAANEMFMKLKMANEVSEAKIRSAQKMGEMQIDIDQNPQDWTPEKVSGRLTEIGTESSSGFSFQAGKDSFANDYKLAAIASEVKSNHTLRAYQIENRGINQAAEIETVYGLDPVPRSGALKRILKESRELGMYHSTEATDAIALEQEKKWEIRDINNTAVTDPDTAATMIEAMTHNTDETVKNELRATNAAMKTKVNHLKALAAAQASAASDTDLFEAYQQDALTVPYVDASIERNPLMDKVVADKWKKIAASKASLTGASNGRDWNRMMAEFTSMLNSNDAKSLAPAKLRKEKFNAKEYLKVLQLKGELLDKNARGEIVGDEFKGAMKFFNYSLEENNEFMKKYSYFATAFSRAQLWGRKVTASMSADIASKRLSKSYADVVDLGLEGPVKDNGDNLAMDVFNAFLMSQEMGSKLKKIKGESNLAEMDKALNSVFAVYDKKIAENNYDIKTSPDGKEWVQHEGGSFEVKGYSNGSPMVSWNEATKG